MTLYSLYNFFGTKLLFYHYHVFQSLTNSSGSWIKIKPQTIVQASAKARTLGGRREGGYLSFFFSQQCQSAIAILNLQPPVPRQTPLVQSSVPQILTMPPSRVGPSPSYGTPHTILDLTGTDRTKKKEAGLYWPTCHTRAAALTLQPLPRGCPGKDLTHWFELQPELRVEKTICLQATQSQINLLSKVKFILNCLEPNFSAT